MNSQDRIERLTAEFLEDFPDYPRFAVESAIREAVALLGSADDRNRIRRLALHSLSATDESQSSFPTT